jgi:TonB family protein
MKARHLFVLIPLVFGFGSAHAERREFTYNVDTEIDASGQVISADVLADIDPAFESTVVDLMKAWKFKPAQKSGQAVATRTAMWIKVVADISDNKQASVSARYLSHGNLFSNRQPPRYPTSAMRMRGEAEIVLDVSFDASGAVTAIDPFVVKVSGGDKRMGQQFYAAAHDAVRLWSVRPEIVDGQPVASRVLIPVSFTLRPSTGKPLRATIDRSKDDIDAATQAALANLDVSEQRSANIGNATGLELVSDDSRG